MNSLYKQMTSAQSNNNIQSIRGMMSRLKALTNPQAAISDMVKGNPQMQMIMQMSQNKNMSLKDMFYSMAKEKGVDPNEILQALQ